MTRHFLDLKDIPAADLRQILDRARVLKAEQKAGKQHALLAGRTLGMIFEKHSTRTRVSFEVGMYQLGGHALNLTSNDLQLGRGETVADTARVLSRYVDLIMMRATDHEKLVELAKYATVPVINGLTDVCHPCQLMADIMTIEEHRGIIAGKSVAWIGDGNNVANSFISAAQQFGFALRLACPPELTPEASYIEAAIAVGADISVTGDIHAAVAGADAVVTDTWVSMGHENSETRRQLLSPFQVTEVLMQEAKKDALFLHCLPAHRGEEMSAEVIDGPRSVVWDEAENRLHAQKAIMLWCAGE